LKWTVLFDYGGVWTAWSDAGGPFAALTFFSINNQLRLSAISFNVFIFIISN